MSISLRNTLFLIVGGCFNFIFLWLNAFVAALPVPNPLESIVEIFGIYYTNILLSVCSLLVSLVLLLIIRKAVGLFSNQNIACLALPIVAFISYVYCVLGFEFEPLIWAAVPTIFIAFLFRQTQPKRAF